MLCRLLIGPRQGGSAGDGFVLTAWWRNVAVRAPSRRVVGVFGVLLGLTASTGFGQDAFFVGCETAHAVLVDLGQDAINGFGVGVTLLAGAAGVTSVPIRSGRRPSQY
jgi:hypothetical protein